jgi:hypothetical protein
MSSENALQIGRAQPNLMPSAEEQRRYLKDLRSAAAFGDVNAKGWLLHLCAQKKAVKGVNGK